MSETVQVRHDHSWELVDQAPDRTHGVISLERCLVCRRFRATIEFETPRGNYLNLGAFLADLDQLGIEYAAHVTIHEGAAAGWPTTPPTTV